MIKPIGGRAMVAGFDVVEQPLEVKKRIGYVPETGALYESLTADEYLELIAVPASPRSEDRRRRARERAARAVRPLGATPTSA